MSISIQEKKKTLIQGTRINRNALNPQPADGNQRKMMKQKCMKWRDEMSHQQAIRDEEAPNKKMPP